MWIYMTWSWWAKICQLILFQILASTWWYWVSRGHCLLVLGGTEPVLDGTDWFLVVLGEYRAVLTGTWLYLVSRRRHWLLLGDTGSEQGGTGCQCDVLSENLWFAWSKGKNVDGQMDRVSSCRLDAFSRKGRVKTYFLLPQMISSEIEETYSHTFRK